MSILNNNGVNANQNNQSLAAEGVVERGRFVVSILARCDIRVPHFLLKQSQFFVHFIFFLAIRVLILSLLIIYNIDLTETIISSSIPCILAVFSCNVMQARTRWMKVHRINCRVHQRIKPLERIKMMNTL